MKQDIIFLPCKKDGYVGALIRLINQANGLSLRDMQNKTNENEDCVL